jgi:cellulose synthase (UDP-forming)
MGVEGLPYNELLSPLIFVLGTIYVLGPVLPLSRSWARAMVFGVVWLVVARYLSWRFFSTVMPADGDWYEIGWVYFCFVVEALALFDAFILYVAFLRTSDRGLKRTPTRRGCARCRRPRCRQWTSISRPSMNLWRSWRRP